MNEERRYSQEEARSPFEGMPWPGMMSQMMDCRWNGWWVMDRLDAIGWAGTFIWGSLVLLAYVTGFFESVSWWDGWGIFFVGMAAIVLGGVAIRWILPRYRRVGLGWGLVFGLVLLAIGLGKLAVWVWPLLLGAIGIAILYSVFIRSR